MSFAWVLAVAVSSSVSFFTVIGFVIQSRALRADDTDKSGRRYRRVGGIVLSPLWVAGATLQVVPNCVGDIIAYTLAPLSLTAPLSGVSVAVNSLLAPRLLGEEFQLYPDLPATILVTVGSVLTTMNGAHDDSEDTQIANLDELFELAKRERAVTLYISLGATLVLCYLWLLVRQAVIDQESNDHFNNPSMKYLMPLAWCAAGIGALTNVSLKLLGELLASGAPWWHLVVHFFTMVIVCAFFQQQCLGRGLRIHPQTVFFPAYSSLLVVTNTMSGMVFFDEDKALDGVRFKLCFGFGVACVIAGICLFSRRVAKEATTQRTAEEAEAMEALSTSLLSADSGLELYPPCTTDKGSA